MLSGLVVVSSFYVQNVFVIHVFVIFALYDALQVPKSMHARLPGPFNVLHITIACCLFVAFPLVPNTNGHGERLDWAFSEEALNEMTNNDIAGMQHHLPYNYVEFFCL